MSTLRIETPRVFAALLEPSRYKGAYGGRGSGKSHFFAEKLIEDCLEHKGLCALSLRETQKSLAQSSKRLLEAKIRALKLGHAFRIWRDRIETPGDGVIVFVGMADHTAESVKSFEGFQRAWIEEAQAFSHRSLTLLRPTLRAKGSEVWASWNPRRKSDAVDEFFRGAQRPVPGAIIVKANWRDNPWFPAELEAERRIDLVRYPDRYDHRRPGRRVPQRLQELEAVDSDCHARGSGQPILDSRLRGNDKKWSVPERQRARGTMAKMSASRRLMGEMIAEAVAMFIIIAFGDSAAAMYTLYDPSPYSQAYWGVCIAWGLAVTIAIYVTGAVSGCHANPAVSLAMAAFRGFSWKKLIPYSLAQVAGAFLGAAVVYMMFQPVIDHFNALHHLTRAGDGGAAGVFFTHPGLAITPLHALGDQVVLTALLMIGIFAVTEERNVLAPQGNAGALIIGLLVATIGASAGYLEAWALNPARDFGPRLLAWAMGWGAQAFPAPGNYWWVPIVGPLIGGVVGAAAHHYLILPYLPSRRAAGLPEPAVVPQP